MFQFIDNVIVLPNMVYAHTTSTLILIYTSLSSKYEPLVMMLLEFTACIIYIVFQIQIWHVKNYASAHTIGVFDAAVQ